MIKDRIGALANAGAVVFASLWLLAAPAGAGPLEDGVTAYQQGNYQAAIDAWMPLADANNPDALFNMGQLYRMGKGVARDPLMAEYFYRRAAELGHVSAQGNLGTLYYFGFDNSPRVAKAVKWWQKAAAGGDPRSQYMLGVLYYNGKYLKQDPVRAYAWIHKAAMAGLPEAVKADKKLVQALSVNDLAAGNNLSPHVQDLAIETADATPVSTADNAASPAPAASASEAEPMAEPAPEAVDGAAADTSAAAKSAPGPEVADEQAPASAVAAGYYVQLAASGSEDRANKARAQFNEDHAVLTGDQTIRIEEAALDDGRTIYRLLLGMFPTRAPAVERCAQIKDAGADCFVVRR